MNKITLKKTILGVAVGIVNGLFGGGGGMILVPMLSGLLNCEQKVSHATAIFIILPLSIVSGLLYFGFCDYDYGVGIPVAIGVLIGGVLGALLLKNLSNKLIKILFYSLMLFAGIKMLIW